LGDLVDRNRSAPLPSLSHDSDALIIDPLLPEVAKRLR